METPPFISIIIPTFNSDSFISATLDSIISQRFSRFEIVCVDGLSTDLTVSLLQEYAERDNRVNLVSEEDQGIYDAMNKGIARAKGTWLYFLGSDDCLFDNEVLEDVVRVLEHSKAEIIYGDAILLSDQQRYGGEYNVLRLHTVQNLCHQTVFYNQSIFKKIGLYNLKYKVLADWELNIRCFRHPGIATQYMRRDIVLFNNLTGISSLPYEDPLYEEIPVLYIKELNRVRGNRLLNSKIYSIAKKVFNLIRKYS